MGRKKPGDFLELVARNPCVGRRLSGSGSLAMAVT